MVYIRNKNVKGIKYAYLVKSEWDSIKNTSKQKTIKYLGKTSELTLDNIPLEYREVPTILNFVLNNNKLTNVIHFNQEIKNKFYDLLLECNIDELLSTYEKYSNSFSLKDFYDFVLKPILYEIGYLWEIGKMDIATEHAITNTVNKFIKLITPNLIFENNHSIKSPKIAILTVDGELHNTACNMFESLLISLKFLVYNLSPSIPTESIIKYMEKEKPDILMISITLPDHINKTNRLINIINEKKLDTNIIIGGQSSHLLNVNPNQLHNILIKSNITFNEFTIMMKNIIKNSSKEKRYKFK